MDNSPQSPNRGKGRRLVFSALTGTALTVAPVAARMFLFLAGVLIAMGVVVARYFSGRFSVGAWVPD